MERAEDNFRLGTLFQEMGLQTRVGLPLASNDVVMKHHPKRLRAACFWKLP